MYSSMSPMVGITHCVTGVGATIALSVYAAESAIGDIDDYVQRLDSAL